MASYRITLTTTSWTVSQSYIWYDKSTAKFYSDSTLETEVSSVPPATRSGFVFKGWFNTTTGTTQYIDANGNILDALRTRCASMTSNIAIYAQGKQPFKITISLNSGSGTNSFWYDSVNGRYFSTSTMETEISAIVPPTRERYALSSIRKANNDTADIVVNADGTIAADYAPTAAATIYCRWTQIVFKVTVNKASGTGGTSEFYVRNGANGKETYSDAAGVTPLSSIVPCTQPGCTLNGFFSASSGGVQCLSPSGSFETGWDSLEINADGYVYCQWTKLFSRVTINRQSGTSGLSEFFVRLGSSPRELYTDQALTQPLTEPIPRPYREGYVLKGLFTESTDGDGWKIIDADGYLTERWDDFGTSSDTNLYAQWGAMTPVYLSKGQGSGGTDHFLYNPYNGRFYIGTDEVTAIVPPTREGYVFYGYYDANSEDSERVRYVDGNGRILQDLVSSNPTSEITIYASYGETIGLMDYFGAEGNILMLSQAESGESRNEVETLGSTGTGNSFRAGHYDITASDSSKGAFWKSDAVINPKCTYKVKASGSVSFVLGHAWNTASGKYFLTSVEYKTAADGEPILVLTGTANEGADAINLWTVTFNVSPDHIAQDPLNAISGGGELLECSLKASAEPVVPYENGVPCASDIVGGKIVVSAVTAAYLGELKPVARSPFVECTGVNKSITDVDSMTYSIQATRSL